MPYVGPKFLYSPNFDTVQREIEEAGVKCEQLCLANFGDLRGVMAKTAIKSGATMISYPRSAIMDLASHTQCPCPELIQESYWQAAPWWVLHV